MLLANGTCPSVSSPSKTELDQQIATVAAMLRVLTMVSCVVGQSLE